MRGIKDYLLILLKGSAMGIADLVPGVSGGTIAFISGIYEELLDTIKSINANALSLLLKFRIMEFWKHINGWFLISLLSGIGLSVVLFSGLIHHLLRNEPISIWSLFFGLILISSLSIAKKIQNRSVPNILIGILGIITGYLIVTITPSGAIPNNSLFIFLSGSIAICAMILPGISGSFILLILGKYHIILTALKNLDFFTILTFLVGCVVGILSFARVVSWTFKRFHDQTVALLSGFMIGSLYKVWPWKIVDQYRMNSKGEQVPFLESSVWPNVYQIQTGNDPELVNAILFFALGIMLVVVLEKINLRKEQSQ